MDNTLSVSKGCFIFKNGKRRVNNSAKQPPNTTKTQKHSCLLSKDLAEQPFYKAFLSTWTHFQSKIEQLQRERNSRTLKDLIAYITNDYIEDYLKEGMTEIVPTAAVLTGINQSDHFDQFNAISQRIVSETSSSVCILNSRDCQSIKGAIESLVYNFIGAKHADDYDGDRKRLRKSQCTIKQLRSWYSDNSDTNQNKNEMSKLLVVILPDFECFNPIVLQDLISILSTQQKYLPFLLILGIATNASIIHNVLPYHVTSKIKLRIFRTQAAPQALNDILEKVILSPRNVFHLSGKNFKFLTHVFLYYDFSIHGFIQSFKYCLMEHFIRGNCFALCTEYSKSLKYIQLLSHEDIEKLRQMLSFRPYVEKLNDCKRIISILTDDDYFKKKLPQMLKDCHLYFLCFHAALEFLYTLVEDLPKAPLGKQRHQLYELCSSKSVVEEAQFRECLKVLSIMSREEFLAKITNAITTSDQYLKDEIEKTDLGKECNDTFQAKFSILKMLIHNMLNADVATKQNTITESLTKADSPETPKKPLSRQELKDHLLQKSKQGKPISEFNKLVNDILNYIEKEIVSKHLLPLQQAPALHEIFIFTDIATIRRNIIGAPRSALHMSLNNPYYYLQCNCCSLSDSTQLLQSLPDISIVYKLHLECGRMINLFDWLQAFRSVVNSLEDDPDQVDPHVQARFTRAVAELQFLGYIKMSKRKTDHATRLTW